MLAYLMPGMAYGFAAAVTPGPLSMYLISQSVSNGWRRTLPAALSPLASDAPVAVLVLTVLSQVPVSLVQYLRLLGGVFILYLAFGAGKSWRNLNSEKAVLAESKPNSFLRAAIVNWLNPNPYLGWSIVLGPIVLSGWHESPINGIVLILGFYMTMIAAMMGMILMFAAAGTLGPRVRRSLIGLSSLGLAGLGLYQLWMGSSVLHAAL
jgi:threonine/homoserine/homoserine lactone efflux protein